LTALGPALLRATTPPSYGAEQAKQFAALNFSVHAAPNGVSPLRSRFEDPLWLLLAIAALVLLTACANVASLFLVRATAREPELALRVALGASTMGSVGVISSDMTPVASSRARTSPLTVPAIATSTPSTRSCRTIRNRDDVGADWRVVAFHILIVGLTTAAFALAPSLRATRRAQIGSSGRVTSSRERVATRELLVAAQVALSVVLVSAAMLFLVTFRNLASLDVGFRTDEVLVANVFLDDEKYPSETRGAVQRELTNRLAGIPGIDSAAHGSTPPYVGANWDTVVNVKTAHGEIKAETNRNQISAGYFRVLRTPLFAGRDFNDRDTPFSPKVAVVNETFARQAFGDARRLGGRFTDGADEFQVVGIVGNSKLHTVRVNFRPIVYTAASQVAQPGLTVRFVLRSRIDMRAMVDSVRRAVSEFDRTAGIRFATLDSLAADSLQRERLMASLSGFFGIIAIVLAAVGVYGVVSYSAAAGVARLVSASRLAHTARMSFAPCLVAWRLSSVPDWLSDWCWRCLPMGPPGRCYMASILANLG
jgi:putative ABC transport system permease protein